jgi:UDP-N-acetylmuramate dehydrogenase
MEIKDNYNIINNNTFGVALVVRKFVEYYNDCEIIDYVNKNAEVFKSKFLIIGEGSNILFTNDYDVTVIHPATKNISIVAEDSGYYYVEASAGVIFNDLIDWSVKNGAYGLENLSGIPGTAGASAVQNVGAYGAEAKDFIYEVKFIDLESQTIRIFTNADCEFDYRSSVFKNKLKEKVIVLSVTFRLSKVFVPNLSYVDLKKYFLDFSESKITACLVRDAVTKIRNSKLPNPKVVGNAGSFFKNPIVEVDKFNVLRSKFPDIKFFDHNENKVKLVAWWLIDTCGLKGVEVNGAAVHDKQALVLVNKNNASGCDILKLSKIVQKKVYEVFGIELEPEVLIV